MDKSLDSGNASPDKQIKKKKRKSGSSIGRHRRGKKQKQCRPGTLVATFPTKADTTPSSSISDNSSTPPPTLAPCKASDRPIIKQLRNKSDYAHRMCAKKDKTLKQLLDEKEVMVDQHHDPVFLQKQLKGQVAASQANELKANILLKSRTKRWSESLDREKEKSKTNNKLCKQAKLIAETACTDAKKRCNDAKKSVDDTKKKAVLKQNELKKEAAIKQKELKKAAVLKQNELKKEAVLKQKEIVQIHKGQLELLARDHGEAIKMTKTKAKADVKVAIEKGGHRLDRSRRVSKGLRDELKVSY